MQWNNIQKNWYQAIFQLKLTQLKYRQLQISRRKMRGKENYETQEKLNLSNCMFLYIIIILKMIEECLIDLSRTFF